MAYESVRAQLDKLLGADRNGPVGGGETEPTDYRNPSICKHFLLGFCPHDLYIKHRSEPGSCRLQHSERAKAAFEKDVASGEARYDKARWIAALYSECNSIVLDEDRKIRVHARRLQETYAAGGDLAGLMIKNFDTLKKLGMVRPDAKVRVLSEMDDENDFVNGIAETEKKQDANVSEKKDDDKDVSDNEQKANGKASAADDNDSVKSGGGFDSDSDSDDDDDFGLIKVIPATGDETNTIMKTGEEESKAPVNAVQAESSKAGGPVGENQGAGSVKKEEQEKGNKRSPSEKEEQANENDMQANDKAKVENAKSEGKSVNNDQDTLLKDQETSAEETDTPPLGKGKAEESSEKPTSPGKDYPANAQTLMDQFYEKGVGPDGLLMLDRKQSLRVCACCGGYISLVDAESRLLSHYGGKSHHSLVLVRAKVGELKEQIAKEPIPMRPPRRGPYKAPFRNRDQDWGRRSDDRPRYRGRGRQNGPPDRHGDRYGGRQGDRYGGDRYGDPYGERRGERQDDRWGGRGRQRRDQPRGYGTTDWYNHRGNDRNRGYGRPPMDRSRNDYRYEDRHDNDRKRHRSPSPYNRRYRRRY